MRKILLLLLSTIFTAYMAYAQGNGGTQIKGRLLDAQTKEPLIGATVTIKGTTNASTVTLDGTFKIRVPEGGNTTLAFSYIGYVSKEVVASQADLGTITLDPTSASVKEVVVTANSSIAIDRHTPIAASSVGKIYIEEKGAGAEFPELLKATPGVMTSKGGGGYGDSRINIRGFSSNNVALLINGIPVNDVEAGKIYWNDWAGLADVTASMQVQRGLGASKVAVPSLGGTINITTKSTELEEGGTISQSIGTFNAQKTLITYSSGLSQKGWATSFLLSRSTGDGYSPGLYYTGYSYFANISKILSKTQTLSFNLMGATQNHGQRYTFNTINTYRSSALGIRYNSDYGYLNGDLTSAEQNYYNKPLASINHNWQINETSSLATVLYASYGTGAARYLTGTNVTLTPGTGTSVVPRTGDIYSPIDFNAITKANVNSADGSASRYFLNSVNDHKQYGILSSYKKKIGDIDLLAGIDGRYYEGEHYNQVQDLLGGQYIVDALTTGSAALSSPKGNINNPNAHIINGGRFNNDYRYEVASEGVYVQAEYNKDDLSAFVSLAGNNTSNRRVDYFDYLNSDPNRISKWVNFLGYQAKGGANYNIDEHSNVFANIGYIQRAPLVANIFVNKRNDLNPDAKPEKLMSYELGYGFRSSVFSANINAYRSTYKDRAKTSSFIDNTDNSLYNVNISGINELHQGIEFDAKLRPIKDVTLSGSFSIGDYHYTSNTGPTQITSDAGKSFTQDALLLKGLKVGEFGTSNTSAQTTAALGLDIQVLPQVKIGANYNYYGRYYASFDPSKLTTTQQAAATVPFTNYQLPNYSTVDLNAVYRFKFAGLDAAFIANVYNLFNTTYIADAFETAIPGSAAAYGFVPRTNALGVWYGAPRTYMTTFKINF